MTHKCFNWSIIVATLLSLVPWLSVAFEMIHFCPVSDELGSRLCTFESPTLAISGVTKTHCSLECLSMGSGCTIFTYNQSKEECAIHQTQPTLFSNGPNDCSCYQVCIYEQLVDLILLILRFSVSILFIRSNLVSFEPDNNLFTINTLQDITRLWVSSYLESLESCRYLGQFRA